MKKAGWEIVCASVADRSNLKSHEANVVLVILLVCDGRWGEGMSVSAAEEYSIETSKPMFFYRAEELKSRWTEERERPTFCALGYMRDVSVEKWRPKMIKF